MEIYFSNHMADRDLLFHEATDVLLKGYDQESAESDQMAFLSRLYQTANAPDHPIRNRLLRLTADSPDLLAIIKEEGKT